MKNQFRWIVRMLAGMAVMLAFSCACVMAVADNSLSNTSIYIGQYEQDDEPENGQEPIEWIIVDETEDSYLLISRYVLDYVTYSDVRENAAWSTSSLRRFLEEDFLPQAFSEEERQFISRTNHVEDGIKSRDLLFVPSLAEQQRYLTGENAKGVLTPSALREVASLLIRRTINWWLRDIWTSKKTSAVIVDGDGKQAMLEVTKKAGVRPMMRISKDIDLECLPYSRYNSAVRKMESGNYQEAALIFHEISGYANSASLLDKCTYNQACVFAENGQHDLAIAGFEALGVYENSYELCR